MNAVMRIVNSQKVILATIAGVSSLAASWMGFDPTEGVMLIANAAFGLLIAIQGILDFKWGSKSDGTGQ